MESVRRAVIDIGTNSVKVLVADVAGQEVRPVWEESKQTRLGRGLYKDHQLRPESIAATADATAAFARVAADRGAASVRVIATSAARDARNAAELDRAINERAGLDMEIISGDQEAEWAFLGFTSDARFSGSSLLLFELGGGSCQFSIGRPGEPPFHRSFALGTVRLMEHSVHSDPPSDREYQDCRRGIDEFLAGQVRPAIDPVLLDKSGLGRRLQFVGVGGTATILACIEAELTHFDRDRLEAVRLSMERMKWLVRRLWSVPLEERKHIPGLPPNRADIILMGVAVYEAVMEHFGLSELRVSTRGLRFGALMDRKSGK